MSIDTDIALQTRGVKLNDPLDTLGKVFALRQAGQQSQLHDLSLEKNASDARDQKALSLLYQQNVGSDGSIDSKGLIRQAAGAGLGYKVPGLYKEAAERDKATLDQRSSQQKYSAESFDLQKKKAQFASSTLLGMINDPGLSLESVTSTIKGLGGSGHYTPEEVTKGLEALPKDPTQLRPYLVAAARKNQELQQHLDLYKPDVAGVDTGAEQIFVDKNPNTNPKWNVPIQKQLTPAQILEDRRVRELATPGSVIEDAKGNQYVLPRGAPGQEPVKLTVDGKPLTTGEGGKGGKPPSAEERKAANWLVDARSGYDQMHRALLADPKVHSLGWQDALEKVPSFGFAAEMAQAARSPERKAFLNGMQRARSAFLRAATGAGFSENEAKDSFTYMPSPGDGPVQTKEKMELILDKMRAFELMAGRSLEGVNAVFEEKADRKKNERSGAALPEGQPWQSSFSPDGKNSLVPLPSDSNPRASYNKGKESPLPTQADIDAIRKATMGK
jgi:hypothetical protein